MSNRADHAVTNSDGGGPDESSGPRTVPVFNDGKAPEALRTIGEVARALAIKPHVLRYWEQQFPMLRPLTRAGGRRYYRPEDVTLLIEIDRLLNREGYTIRGARAAIEARARKRPAGRVVAKAQPAAAADAADQPAALSPATPSPTTPPPAGTENAMPAEEEIAAALRILRAHLAAIRDRLAAALD